MVVTTTEDMGDVHDSLDDHDAPYLRSRLVSSDDLR